MASPQAFVEAEPSWRKSVLTRPAVRPPLWLKDPRLWILLGATIVGLALAWAVKAPCVGANWDGLQYERLCYNDIQPLYGARHMDKDVLPYVDSTVAPGQDPDDLTNHYGFLEYPVLTGLVMHLAARMSMTGDEFMIANAVLLSLFAIATTFFLYHTADDKRRIALFALGPPLFLYAFHNWDLIAVFFTALALYHQKNDQPLGAGIALALGASAKMYPAFLAPAFGLAVLRQERRLGPRSWRFGLGFLGAALAANLPFYLANPNLFLETYRFHLRRDPNFETLWYVIGHYGRKWELDWMNEAVARETLSILVPLGLLTGLLLVGILVWKGRLDAIQGGFASLVLFMVFNKIFSVQYALWLLPFFVILNLSMIKYAAYTAADLAVYVTIFTFFLHTSDGQAAKYFDYLAVSVLARTGALVWLLVETLRSAMPRRTSLWAAHASAPSL